MPILYIFMRIDYNFENSKGLKLKRGTQGGKYGVVFYTKPDVYLLFCCTDRNA